MTIFRADWFQEFNALTGRLAVAHGNLTKIAALLRNTSADIWPIVPQDAASPSGGIGAVEGWRSHFTSERQRMVAFLATNRNRATTESAAVVTAMDGYIVSVGAMSPAFNAIRATYLDGSGDVVLKKVPQANRDILATAIENELEA